MTHPEATPPRKELGPYQLGLLLGEGGMGALYKAFDDRLGRWVAAKRLRGDASATARERFRREARTLAQLGHPAIVQIFDVVEDDAGDWIVMELVDGPTLAELRRDGPLDVGLALDYARQIASALDAAHASGIVHRDLKTENVMVLPSGHVAPGRAAPGRAAPGRVKILDFGLARRVGSPPTDATLPEGLAAPADATLSQPGRPGAGGAGGLVKPLGEGQVEGPAQVLFEGPVDQLFGLGGDFDGHRFAADRLARSLELVGGRGDEDPHRVENTRNRRRSRAAAPRRGRHDIGQRAWHRPVQNR